MPKRIMHARVQSGEIRLAKYSLTPFGLVSSIGDITIDDKIALLQQHHDTELCLCPLGKSPHPELSEAWFYADCIAFDHEIPVIVNPTPSDIRGFGYRYIYNGSNEERRSHPQDVDTGELHTIIGKQKSPEALTRLFLSQQLVGILSEIRDFHHGPLTFIRFRYDGWEARQNIPYTQAYSLASQEIHLYASALRQADPYSEFLSYYRVIESASNSNGMTWIASALSRLRVHRFDDIKIGMASERESRSLLAIYRRRALIRLRTLLKTYPTPDKIAGYLYGVNRCGIAHGRQIIRSDITPSYFEMVRDTYVIKLLARMAIDEKLGPSRL